MEGPSPSITVQHFADKEVYRYKLSDVDTHEYSPQQALDLLMRSLRHRDAELAAQIQAVIDAGRDIVDETESSRKPPKRSRTFRKTVPYTFEQAIQVALDALRAYFIEQPLFVNSNLHEISAVALESPLHDRHSWRLYKERSMEFDPKSQGHQKATEIELRTETQISESARETFAFEPVPRMRMDLSPILRQMVKTHFSLNGELSHGVVT